MGKLPKFIEVSLEYPYLEEAKVYVFPRLRKRDSDMDERERLLGQGRKMKPSDRLAGIAYDVQGWEDAGLDRRQEDEADGAFANRVARFFDSEEMQEFAEDALVYRLGAVFPKPSFRSFEGRRVAVDILRAEGGQHDAVLPDVHQAGTTAGAGMSGLPADTGPRSSEEADKG